jgi:hypothetical protein
MPADFFSGNCICTSRNLLKNGQICAVEGPKSSDDSSALMLNRLFRVPR